MTRQTTEALTRLNLSVYGREARGLADLINDGEMTVDLPYQRGSVWTLDQRIALVKSWMTGTPIPAVIVNDRSNHYWTDNHGGRLPAGEPAYAVIDGRQRLETAVAWFAGEFGVPSTWFEREHVAEIEPTDDGLYVRYTGLTKAGRTTFTRNAHLPVGEAKVGTLEEEAEIYLRVNGGGTDQTSADMERAAQIAGR